MRIGAWKGCLAAGLLVLGGCAERSNLEIMQSARDHLARKNVPAATIELRTLLQRKPNASEARFLLGKIFFDAGDMASAEDQLGQALQFGYPEEEVVPLLAQTLASLNRTKAIVTLFGEFEFKDPQATADLKVQVAKARIREREIDPAERDIERALTLVPGQPDAMALRARLKAIRGDEAGAGRDVDELLARAPLNAEALALKADLLMMSGPQHVDAALAMHRKALAQRPNLSLSHAAVLSMLIARGDLAGASEQWTALKAALPAHPQTRFFEGVLALLKGDAERASGIANAMLQASPTDLRLLLLGGQAELQRGHLEQAEALLGRAAGVASQAATPRHLLAEVYLRTGRAEETLKVLAPLLGSRGPADAMALTLAGRAQMIAGDAAGAKTSFARALELSPTDQRVRTSAAIAKLGAGQGDAAMAELESIAKTDNSTTADLALINARLARGQFAEASKAVDALAAKQPSEALPEDLRGRIALGLGNRAAARTHFEAALTKQAGYFPALSQLVALDVADGKPDAAQARLEAARQRNPRDAQLHLALADLASRRGAPASEVTALLDAAVRLRPTDALPHLALVDHHFASGRRDLALQAAEKAVTALPDSQAALDRLGMAHRARGDAEQAIATYNKMVLQFPRSTLGNLRLSEVYLDTGKTALAAERVQPVLKDAPRLVAAQRVAAVVALRQGKTAQAFAIGQTVQQQRPDDAVGYELEAEIAMAVRQFERAAAAYRKALDRQSTPTLAKRLHLALIGAKRPADAQRWAETWLQRNPQDTPFVVHLADVALGQGDLPQAEARYREVTERLPGNALAINNLAYTLVKQNKSGGLELAERAAQLAPKDAAVLDTLAAAYLAGNQLGKAIEWQSKAVELQPDTGALRMALARMYIQAGDREKAVQELDRLATLGRSFSGYSEVAQLRKKLGP